MGAADLTWRKSSHSGGNSNCVEAARVRDAVRLRDSKNPAAGTLEVPLRSWSAFLRGADRAVG
ncbi:DUF397 domain-containing protein [Saccharothrix yanglingensis]|uniref:DUF397 domain-containing protein n=1 Tax=Saccharothrix yanglingensis TaxID=659496 RepID=A0ABU0X4S8_9PSEU|nr:DUF397 domain-containing protein [Saccharothrix yanglingensis]MDQ2587124.1 DUF397 domain-containing protein [Saccharothrix yanglingensis]